MATKMIKKYQPQVGVLGQGSNVQTSYVADEGARAMMQSGQQLQRLGRQAEGIAIKEYDKRSAIEYQYAMNEANKRLNDFTLALHNDKDYGSYDEKRIATMDLIREEVGDTFKSEKARSAFNTWLQTKEENVRFATSQLAQQKEDEELTAKGMAVYNDAVENGDLEVFEQSLVALSDILSDTQIEQLRQDGLKKIEISDVYEDQRIALENGEDWEFDEEAYPNLNEKERHALDIAWQESVNRKKAAFNHAESELQKETFAGLVDDLIERPGSLTNARLEALTIPDANGMIALDPSVRLSLYNAAKNALKGNMTSEQKNILDLSITPEENKKLFADIKTGVGLAPWEDGYISPVDILDQFNNGNLTYRQQSQLQSYHAKLQSQGDYSSQWNAMNSKARRYIGQILGELDVDDDMFWQVYDTYEQMTTTDIDPGSLKQKANEAMAMMITENPSKFKLKKWYNNNPTLAGEIVMSVNMPDPKAASKVIDTTQKIINAPKSKELQTCEEIFGK